MKERLESFSHEPVQKHGGQAFASVRKDRNARLRAALEKGVQPDAADLAADKNGYLESWRESRAAAGNWTYADYERLCKEARIKESQGPLTTNYNSREFREPARTNYGNSGAGRAYDPYDTSTYRRY